MCGKTECEINLCFDFSTKRFDVKIKTVIIPKLLMIEKKIVALLRISLQVGL